MNPHPILRRDFLSSLSGGFSGLALTHLLARDAAADAPVSRPELNGGIHHRAKVKRVIQLFMNGGVSPMDTWDYKPGLTKLDGQKLGSKTKIEGATGMQGALMKSPFEFKPHGQCGKWVSSVFPEQAKLVDEMAFLQAMTGRSNVHGQNAYLMNNGFQSLQRPPVGIGVISVRLILILTWLASWLHAAESDVAPGLILVASGEGISVFNRSGEMPFGKFFVPVADGKGGATPWSDMGYDGWRLKSGRYLCSAHEWVREISSDGQIVWEYRVQKPVELKTCVPLPNGDVVTTDASTQELVWLAKGQVMKRAPIPSTLKAAPHNRYNLLRRTAAGTFLVALRTEKTFVEVDESGKELWRHTVPDLPVVAERLGDGNTLMSWRGGLLEVNPKNEVVWELKSAEITEFPVIIFGGFHRFENGNTLIANSDWHYKAPGENRVQLFEITRDKKVVWKLGVEAFAGKKPGSLEPKTGNIEHRIIGIQWLGEDRK